MFYGKTKDFVYLQGELNAFSDAHIQELSEVKSLLIWILIILLPTGCKIGALSNQLFNGLLVPFVYVFVPTLKYLHMQDTLGRYYCVGLKRANEIIGTTTEELVLKAKQGVSTWCCLWKVRFLYIVTLLLSAVDSFGDKHLWMSVVMFYLSAVYSIFYPLLIL